MTELTFLVDLLLNHKLPTTTRKLIAERIATVESQLTHAKTVTQLPHRVNPTTVQAPSTQAILDRMVDAPPVLAMAAMPPAAARVVGGEIQTGKNTRGPRKF